MCETIKNKNTCLSVTLDFPLRMRKLHSGQQSEAQQHDDDDDHDADKPPHHPPRLSFLVASLYLLPCPIFWPLSAICAFATFGVSPAAGTCASPGNLNQDALLSSVQLIRLGNCTLTLICMNGNLLIPDLCVGCGHAGLLKFLLLESGMKCFFGPIYCFTEILPKFSHMWMISIIMIFLSYTISSFQISALGIFVVAQPTI